MQQACCTVYVCVCVMNRPVWSTFLSLSLSPPHLFSLPSLLSRYHSRLYFLFFFIFLFSSLLLYALPSHLSSISLYTHLLTPPPPPSRSQCLHSTHPTPSTTVSHGRTSLQLNPSGQPSIRKTSTSQLPFSHPPLLLHLCPPPSPFSPVFRPLLLLRQVQFMLQFRLKLKLKLTLQQPIA